jgi:hypothetical protein
MACCLYIMYPRSGTTESGLEAVESTIPHLRQSWRGMTPSEIDCGQFGVVMRMSNLDPGVNIQSSPTLEKRDALIPERLVAYTLDLSSIVRVAAYPRPLKRVAACISPLNRFTA